MKEKNDFLKDESSNDKQLIKDLSIYLRNHKSKKTSVNKSFIKDIIDIVARNSEFDYQTINFINNSDFNAIWYFDEMDLEFNMTSILNTAKSLKEYTLNSKIGDNNIFIYFYVLEVIIHELTHARQQYVKNEIYNSSRRLIDENYDTYLEKHDEVLIERYAHLRGYTIAYDVLSYLYPLNQIQELRKVIWINLLKAYKIKNDKGTIPLGYENELPKEFEIISAINTYNEIMNASFLPQININLSEDMELYDRLYLGLPISKEEYLNLKSLYGDIYYNKKKETVKELIKKL